MIRSSTQITPLQCLAACEANPKCLTFEINVWPYPNIGVCTIFTRTINTTQYNKYPYHYPYSKQAAPAAYKAILMAR